MATSSAGSVKWDLDVDDSKLKLGLAEAKMSVATLGDTAKLAETSVGRSFGNITTSLGKTTVAGEATGKSMTGIGIGAAAVSVGIGILGEKTVKAAGDFQASMVLLTASAGESTKNLDLVSAGVLRMAVETGTSTQQLASGLYTVESAGFHGAAGLTVLKAAAEGAKAENADMSVVTDALTTVLHNYGLGADKSVSVTNQMIAAVSAGKLHLQDFSASLSTVLPIANQVGLSFAQIAGAEATLTAGGISADQATQDLHAVISSLQAPSQAQIKLMQQLGLNSVELSQNMGKNGLTGTLQQVTDAITKSMGPSGLVIQQTMQNATNATKDAQIELKAMPTNLQALAKGFLNGSVSAKDWRKELAALPPLQQNLLQQFATTAKGADSFNALLKSGSPAAETYAAALKTLTGQSNAMNAVTLLTGPNMATFQTNVNSVADAAKRGGEHIASWSEVQGEFNQKMNSAKEAFQTTGIAIGTALLPVIGTLMDNLTKVLEPLTSFITNHKTLSATLIIAAASIAGLIAGMIGLAKVVEIAKGAFALLSTALAGNPIGLIVIAVAALVIGFTLLQQKFDIFGKAARGLKPFLDPITSAFKEIWSVLVQALQPAFDNLKASFDILGKALAPYLPQLEFLAKVLGVTVVASVIATVAVVATLIAVFANVIAIVVRVGANVYSAFLGIEKVVLDTVGAIGKAFGVDTLWKAGEDLITGLVSGIANNAGAVVNKIKEICAAALDAVKSFFGIHSPSTVMASMGGYLMEGLANGIHQSSGLATDAVSKVSAGLQSEVGGLTMGITGQRGAGSQIGRASGTNVVQNNTYHVYNQTDLKQANIDAGWGLAHA